MKRYRRERPAPGWEVRNKRGPGGSHPDYQQAQLIELREQGDQLMYQKRQLIRRLEEASQLGEDTDKLEDELASLQGEHELIERKIKKYYD